MRLPNGAKELRRWCHLQPILSLKKTGEKNDPPVGSPYSLLGHCRERERERRGIITCAHKADCLYSLSN